MRKLTLLLLVTLPSFFSQAWQVGQWFRVTREFGLKNWWNTSVRPLFKKGDVINIYGTWFSIIRGSRFPRVEQYNPKYDNAGTYYHYLDYYWVEDSINPYIDYFDPKRGYAVIIEKNSIRIK